MKRIFILLENPSGNSSPSDEEKIAEYVCDSLLCYLNDPWGEEFWPEKIENDKLISTIQNLNSIYPGLIKESGKKELLLEISKQLKNSLFLKNKEKMSSILEEYSNLNDIGSLMSFIKKLQDGIDTIYVDESCSIGFFEDCNNVYGISEFACCSDPTVDEYPILGIYTYHV